MNVWKKIKDKLPVVVTMCCCVAVAGLSAIVRGGEETAEVSANASPRRVIILDAGHGGFDSGCIAVNGAYEKDINLSIVKNLGQLLSFNGYEVVYTRKDDAALCDEGVEGIRNQKVSDMENRLEIIKKYPESIFLSIHQNQYTESEYSGAQMFYTTRNSGNFRLANIMQQRFSELQTGNDRTAKLIENQLYLFKDTDQQALLVECGFLSNPEDAENLCNEEYQKKVAFTIYRGLTDYIAEASAEDVNSKEKENNGEAESFLYMQ